MFKLWSETNIEIKEQLKPDLWIRSWDFLNKVEKEKIWKYLEEYFFNKDKKIYKRMESPYWERIYNYEFSKTFNVISVSEIISHTIYSLNQKYKSKSYWINFLKNQTLLNACNDFYNIFMLEDENVVLELLSLYALILHDLSIKRVWWYYYDDKISPEENDKHKLNHKLEEFDDFSKRLNEVFNDFWLNIILTRQWFIPKQWEKIIEEIYKPTLDFLSDGKYKEVNRDLWDAFSDYHKKDYSWTITKTISAIQAFLQISIKWEVWKWDIADLISEAIKKELIPNDIFTITIFKNINSIIMRERQETADAHPKKEYANEQNARLILNLSMIFMQHFIQIEK